MENESGYSEKSLFRLNAILLVCSSFFILLPSLAGLFLETAFAGHCICVINYLSYAWIAFAICILLCIKMLLLRFMRLRIFGRGLKYIEKTLLILSGTAFIAGLVLYLIFICKYLNVL